AFIVGLATAVGAGISMAFSEALSDDGKISGRGSPWLRGVVEGFMTFLGAIGHALPFLIKKFETALLIASVVVAIELVAIAYIRNKYMDTPFLSATFQVIVGGLIVLGTGMLIGKL
ncbi:MAG: rubrerythrin, partial [Deltaproteobacteria bacterium]|nr:rubrerythrin [Deltaproteobacteria bacterium]